MVVFSGPNPSFNTFYSHVKMILNLEKKPVLPWRPTEMYNYITLEVQMSECMLLQVTQLEYDQECKHTHVADS